MSQRLEKLKRRAARAELGISKQAEREQREFEAQVAAVRAAATAALDEPIASRAPRRRMVAIVCVAILAAWLLAFMLAGAR